MRTLILAILLMSAVVLSLGHHDTSEEGISREMQSHEHVHEHVHVRGENCTQRDVKDDFLRIFLRKHCAGAEGNYDLCRQCVGVACLQYVSRPTQDKRYQQCIDEHNRCCTKPGVSTRNVVAGAKCYVTGWISEVGWGQVSVIRTLLGGQSPDAPDSITGNM